MTSHTDDHLAKLVAAKLNHDYVSPLTAISNGLEIFQMDESLREDAIGLIGDSLTNALSELQFNRIAFGAYGDDEQLSLSDTNMRIQNMFKNDKLSLESIQLKEPPFKYDAKLWYLCILCMRTCFVQFNSLSIKRTDQGWQLIASGTGMKNSLGENRGENEWLQIAKITPTTVQFPLMFLHADKLNYEVIFKRVDDEQFIVNFWHKRE